MDNSIAQVHPELLSEWSPRNRPVTAQEVSYGSKKLYWWMGACGHEWQTSPKARSAGEGCPVCSNARIIPGVNDLASRMPEIAMEWSPKNSRRPTEVAPGSHKKAIWIGKCGHEWEASIRARVRGTGCPYCSHNLVLPGFKDLESRVPEVAKEWSPRNFPELPSQVTAFSNKRKWWRCEKGHEWYTHISTRSYGSKCPYCTGILLLKGYNDLAMLHPDLASEWSDRNGELQPDMVNDKNTRNVWWKCKTCGNEYKAVIKSRVHGLQCPVCTQRAVLTGHNDLETTDPKLAWEWDVERNGGKLPTQISRNSLYSVWWTGRCGHSWKDKVFHRAVEHAGCIYCEKDTKEHLPQLLTMMYAARNGMKSEAFNEDLIGIPLDVFIPQLQLAFMFVSKETKVQKDIRLVIDHLCERRGICCKHIVAGHNMESVCTAIKQSFAEKHIYIYSDNSDDIARAMEKYKRWRG